MSLRRCLKLAALLLVAPFFACSEDDGNVADDDAMTADDDAVDDDATDDDDTSWPPLDPSSWAPAILVSESFQFAEGPVWRGGDGVLLFSDIDGDIIYQLGANDAVEVYRQPSGRANGLALDGQGLLLAAEHGSRSLTRTRADGVIETVADRYDGQRLNSPNDIAVASDGTVYFSDPRFGLGQEQPELDFMGLFRVTSAGELILEGSFDGSPNGVALSPGGQTLYLAVTFDDQLLSFMVGADGALGDPQEFADVKQPDGMAVDAAGNLYVAGYDGDSPAVIVLDEGGARLGTIPLGHAPTNCGFGGDEFTHLYITAREALYRIDVPIPGA